MIEGITEVGVAVRDLQLAIRHFVDRLGAVAGPVQDFAPYGMRFCMCRVGNVDFELMEPVGEGGVIAQFLERFGEGLHHIGFKVTDVAAAQAGMSARGLGFVDAAPRRARLKVTDFTGQPFDADLNFAFSRPSTLFGTLLEFIQYPPEYRLADSAAGGQSIAAQTGAAAAGGPGSGGSGPAA
jgi:methylmalonyl-CoA/ethylmalonyl-CoA epimerase